MHGDKRQGADIKQKGRDNSPMPLAEALHASEYERITIAGSSEPAHKFEVRLHIFYVHLTCLNPRRSP